MTSSIRFFFLAMAAACTASAATAAEANVTSQALDSTALSAEHIKFAGKLVSALTVQDAQGRHVLVLTSKMGPSRTQPTKSRTERTDLQASYFSHSNGKWTEEWSIKDFVDCPYLHSSATFLTKDVMVTDLNKDGIAEITLPYTTVCGDRVTPTIKVIVRQGKEEFAFHSKSLIKTKDSASLGSSYKADKSLALQQNAVYRQHLDDVWYRVTGSGRSR